MQFSILPDSGYSREMSLLFFVSIFYSYDKNEDITVLIQSRMLAIRVQVRIGYSEKNLKQIFGVGIQ
jgi:hypothetical protein